MPLVFDRYGIKCLFKLGLRLCFFTRAHEKVSQMWQASIESNSLSKESYESNPVRNKFCISIFRRDSVWRLAAV